MSKKKKRKTERKKGSEEPFFSFDAVFLEMGSFFVWGPNERRQDPEQQEQFFFSDSFK